MTARELITGAMVHLEELTEGQTAAPEEYEVGLELLNALLDSLSTQHWAVFVIDWKQYPLVSGKRSYSMGPGGDFDTERPVKIESAGIIRYKMTLEKMDGLRTPLKLIPSTDYDSIGEKEAVALEPLMLFNNNDFPLIYLFLWPVPLCP